MDGPLVAAAVQAPHAGEIEEHAESDEQDPEQVRVEPVRYRSMVGGAGRCEPVSSSAWGGIV